MRDAALRVGIFSEAVLAYVRPSTRHSTATDVVSTNAVDSERDTTIVSAA